MILTVLDLDVALGGNAQLLLGGGLGLYLKQEHLRKTNAKTLLPFSLMPTARTTQDIDLFIRTEVITNTGRVEQLQAAIKALGFVVAEGAKWLKFERAIGGTTVVLDLMVGPLDGMEDEVETRGIRVKPKGTAEIHARATEDAVGVEYEPTAITLKGTRSDGTEYGAQVFVPGAFSYALMKLGALNDRINDQNKDEGRHHALDLYRIAAMLTEQEAAVAADLALRHAQNPVIAARIRVIDDLLAPATGTGRIRLREHPLCPKDANPDWLVDELRRLLTPA